jgi:hypothetical protein
VAKPFSIQSPEDIAKEYAGNKQKIAQAMQMGIVDPTAGVLAGMFIDRMRSAQMQEGVTPPTVAQQVMGGAPPVPAPPLPAGGLGAPEPAAPPMTPDMGMAPPMPAMPAPQGAPMGMADGGLASLPVPDAMFDEPTNGGFDDGYAGGGIVAFQQGGIAEEEEVELGPEGAVGNEILVERARGRPKKPLIGLQGINFDAPDELAGFKSDIFGNLDLFNELAPRKTKRAEELEALIERERSPEERAKRKKEDMWMALAQLGAKMATTPGSLLQAASAGIQEALPGAAAAAKERRGEERALTRELLAEERTSNKEQAERFQVSLDMVVKGYVPLEQALQDRNFRDRWETLGRESQERIARINAAAGITQAGISASAQRDTGRMALDRETMALNMQAGKLAYEAIQSGPGFAGYTEAVKAGRGPDYIQQLYTSFGGTGSFGGASVAPPPGFNLNPR